MRRDFQIIADLVTESTKVLDIGCGDGSLLQYLQENKNIRGRGIEISQEKVTLAMELGLAVIQGDADNDLTNYPANSIDFAILSQTLQATQDPQNILLELQRIAKYVIVSVPNFGYWRNRLYLLLNGRMPVTKQLTYQWYDTPNIHFCTIADFIDLVNSLGFKIKSQFFFNENFNFLPNIKSAFIANAISENAVFLLEKGISIPLSEDTLTSNLVANSQTTANANAREY
jgi:methionine biosynthesis protein MetW